MTPEKHLVRLPTWLDELIYSEIGASYKPCRKNLTVIDWDRESVLQYLGTYFPRSYAESYCIFTNFFRRFKQPYCEKTTLSVFDFGCGTGGEIVGFLDAVVSELPCVTKVYVKPFDGNVHALRLCEEILERYSNRGKVDLDVHSSAIKLKDFYDLGVFKTVMKKKKFDFFISFKAICEFVTKREFEDRNPYLHIIQEFAPFIVDGGRMCLADISSYSDVSGEWLPKMFDRALIEAGKNPVLKHSGWNECFMVSHSRQNRDLSKLTWRII